MSDWPLVSLEEIAAPGLHSMVGGPFGSALGRKDYVDDGVPVIRGAQLSGPGSFSHEDLVFVSDDKANRHPGNLAYPGDLVVTQRGTVGQIGLIPPDAPFERYLLSQSQMKLTVDPARANALFVYYWLRSSEAQDAIAGSTISAGVPHINLATFKGMKIQLPSLPEQQHIAEILGSIDDLIENSRLRVELLEGMAKATYREWFVHFRYPGHEDATFVDSPLGLIPDGWEALLLGDVIGLHYGKALKKDARRGGPIAVIGSSGVVGWHDEQLIAGPAIILGRKGNVGSVTWVDGASWPIDTTYFVSTDLPLRYVAEQLRSTEFLNTHAAVPGLSRDQAYSRPFLRPSAEVMDRFAEVADLFDGEASRLRAQSERLGYMRDLLLPKLVTGQIDVSSLDLDPVVEASIA